MVLGSSEIGGAEKQFLRTVQELEHFHEIHICIIGSPGPFRSVIYQTGIKITESGGSLLNDIITMGKCFIDFKPKLIITWLYRADVIGSLISKLFRVPIVISARNSAWPLNNKLKTFILKMTASFLCDLIIANSTRALEFHKSIGYPARKFRVIRNFLEIQSSSSSFKFSEPITMGLAARPVPGKGHIQAVDAFKELLKHKPEAHLKMIGPSLANWADLLDYIEPFRANILIENGSSNIDIWFEDIDVYLALSTMWDSDSNSVLEAILRRIPVICSPLQSIEDLGDTLCIVDPRSPSEVAKTILTFCTMSVEELETKTEMARSAILELRNPNLLRAQWLNSIELFK